MSRGDLFIVSSPSGAGKTTLIRRVLEDPRIGGTLHFSVSHTTRPPRTGERDGVEYHFVDEAAFRAIEESGGFLEWAVVHGNLYGTSRAEVEPRLEKGLDVLLDIDVQGARQVRSHVPEAVKVIVFPPSREVLEARLKARASDAPEVVRPAARGGPQGDGGVGRVRLCDNQRGSGGRGGRASLDPRGAAGGEKPPARAPRIDPQELRALNLTEDTLFMSQLPPNVESKFRLVHIAARRAEQLVQGARPKIESKHAKVTRIALQEVNADLVRWQLASPEPVVEETPAVDLLPTE